MTTWKNLSEEKHDSVCWAIFTSQNNIINLINYSLKENSTFATLLLKIFAFTWADFRKETFLDDSMKKYQSPVLSLRKITGPAEGYWHQWPWEFSRTYHLSFAFPLSSFPLCFLVIPLSSYSILLFFLIKLIFLFSLSYSPPNQWHLNVT